jgi:hypothetical protein
MAVTKQCAVCGRTFANKSNLNHHSASVHQGNGKAKKKKGAKNIFADPSLKKLSKHGLHMQTLNRVLWNIVLQLIENKRLAIGLTSRRK